MAIACYIRSEALYRQAREALAHGGFDCARFDCDTALLRALRKGEFGLVLVELDADPVSEDRVSTWLNCRDGDSTPVMLLASGARDEQIARALEAGADGFVDVPFDAEELIARVHAVLRCYVRHTDQRFLVLRGFELDRQTYQICDRGVQLELTPREFAMAWLFFSSPGTYLSRDAISAAVWGVDSEIANRTIEQHVYKLRKKLRLSDERGVRIRTAYTRGYRLEVCEPPASGEAGDGDASGGDLAATGN